MRVYHFLSERYALIGLRDRRLKISRIHELNDPFEWAPPSSNNNHQRSAFRKLKRQMSDTSGMLCFSKNWQNPLMWSHYADKHKGLALGFEVPDKFLEHVKYRKSRVKCDWKKFDASKDYASKVITDVLQTKASHWSYEDEARCYLRLDKHTEESGLYFAEFSNILQLREVVVGHDSQVSRSEISKLVDPFPESVSLRKVRLAFGSYRIVNQLDRSLW